ncbi:MAG: hypothetical protein GEU96_18210 [Propionibacteriales bacterium]|nr:hypothetical protein [Propionibacteriales bacterium]
MHGISRLIAAAGMAVALLIAMTFTAQASTERELSQPNGHLSATSSSGATTDRDRDADFNTVTKSDNGGLFYSVFNLTDFAQTVHVRVVLDGPGTVADAVLVDEDVALGPCDPTCEGTQAFASFRVKAKDWPAGTYSLSVTGTGNETVTAVSTFTVHY